MRFSQESYYGMQVMVALARLGSDRPVGLHELASAGSLPQNFLAKILQKLARGGLVVSSRGRRRGYALTAPPGQITLREVLEVTEGPERFRGCLFWPRRCDEKSPCPLHDVGVATRAGLEEWLTKLTVADIAAKERG